MEDPSPANPTRHTGQGPQDQRDQLAAAYDACAAGLYRYALMITADHSAAEDAVQQTFAKLAAAGRRISDIASRNGYLRSAVRNECYRILRHRGRGPLGAENLDSVAILEPVDQAAMDKEQRDAVERALGALPAAQREVVHMKVYEQMTFRQIAEVLGVSLNTAASRYRYALEKLRPLLATHSPAEGRRDD